MSTQTGARIEWHIAKRLSRCSINMVDVVVGNAELDNVILRDQATGLDFIPAPRRSDLTRTSEILGSKRVNEILKQLSGHYDLIVVDTSPLLLVTDGRALIASVDALVLVIKWDSTKREAVEESLNRCFNLEGKFIGAVLNQIVPSKARYYGYYQSGYYMKKYPDYYGGKG